MYIYLVYALAATAYFIGVSHFINRTYIYLKNSGAWDDFDSYAKVWYSVLLVISIAVWPISWIVYNYIITD